MKVIASTRRAGLIRILALRIGVVVFLRDPRIGTQKCSLPRYTPASSPPEGSEG